MGHSFAPFPRSCAFGYRLNMQTADEQPVTSQEQAEFDRLSFMHVWRDGPALPFGYLPVLCRILPAA